MFDSILGNDKATTDKPQGETIPNQSPENGGQVRPTLLDAKATAEGIKQVGVGGNATKSGRGRHPAACQCPLHKGKGPSTPGTLATPENLPPPFTWQRKDIAILGDAPFDVAYMIGGPEHEHWLQKRDAIQSSGCYDKFAYVFNRLGMRDPVYLILAIGLVEYTSAIGTCAASSVKIVRQKKADEELQAQRDKKA